MLNRAISTMLWIFTWCFRRGTGRRTRAVSNRTEYSFHHEAKEYKLTIRDLSQVDGMSREEMNAIENMRNDPELQDWTRRVNEAMARLEKENPEAMQALQEIGRRQSEKMGVAMRELRQKIDNRMGNPGGDGSAPQPRVTPDSAK